MHIPAVLCSQKRSDWAREAPGDLQPTCTPHRGCCPGKRKDTRKFFWQCSALALFHAAAHRGPAPVLPAPCSTSQTRLAAGEGCPGVGCPRGGVPGGMSCTRVSQDRVSRSRVSQLGCAKARWPKSFAPAKENSQRCKGTSRFLLGTGRSCSTPLTPTPQPQAHRKCPANAINFGEGGGSRTRTSSESVPGNISTRRPPGLNKPGHDGSPNPPTPSSAPRAGSKDTGWFYQGLILPCPRSAPCAVRALCPAPLLRSLLRIAPQSLLAQPGTPSCTGAQRGPPPPPKFPAHPRCLQAPGGSSPGS